MILVVDQVRAGESCRSPLSLGSPRRLLAAPQHPQPIPRVVVDAGERSRALGHCAWYR